MIACLQWLRYQQRQPGIDKSDRSLQWYRDSWLQSLQRYLIVASYSGYKWRDKKLPTELTRCLGAGGHTTLMVWADCDDNCANAEALKAVFWKEAERQGITEAQFDRVVFVLAKDRLENWIEFLQTGKTDEAKEGPRVKHNRDVADAAKKLADYCKVGMPVGGMPSSLLWSCKNWRALVERMK